MGPPDIPAPPVDPNLANEQAKAKNDLAKNLQSQTQGDMANLMARYGTMLAFSGANVSPLTGGFTQPGGVTPGARGVAA